MHDIKDVMNNNVIPSRLLKLIACPECRSGLRLEDERLKCPSCNKAYEINDGIPSLLSQLDSREKEQLSNYEEIYSCSEKVSGYDSYMTKTFYKVANENYFFPLLFEKIAPGTIVIDIGCGGGNIGRQLIDRQPYLINIDISLKAIKQARKNISSSNADFLQASVLKIPIVDSSVDIVESYCALHHIEDIEKAALEIRRILRLNGLFLCLEPMQRFTWVDLWLDYFRAPGRLKRCINSLYLKARVLFAKDDGMGKAKSDCESWKRRHFFRGFDEFESVFKKAGFSDVKIKPIYLEFLPPRFFESNSTALVKFLFRLSDRMMKNIRQFSKKGKFVIIVAEKL